MTIMSKMNVMNGIKWNGIVLNKLRCGFENGF